MNTKKGYVSIEAVIVGALITIAGVLIASQIQESMELATVRSLGLTIRLTQDLDNAIIEPYEYETDNPSTWIDHNDSALKDSISNGQVTLHTIALDGALNQTKWLGETLTMTATIDGVISDSNVVYWTILSGSENVILTSSGPGGSTANILTIKQGSTVIRATDQNKTTYKDIVLKIE